MGHPVRRFTPNQSLAGISVLGKTALIPNNFTRLLVLSGSNKLLLAETMFYQLKICCVHTGTAAASVSVWHSILGIQKKKTVPVQTPAVLTAPKINLL